jgi:hypothetical protein
MPRQEAQAEIELDLDNFKNETIDVDGLIRYNFYDWKGKFNVPNKGIFNSLGLQRKVDYPLNLYPTKYISPLEIRLNYDYTKFIVLKSFPANVSKSDVLKYIKQELPKKLKEVLNIEVTVKGPSFSPEIDLKKGYGFEFILDLLVAYPYFVRKEDRSSRMGDSM